VELLWKFGMPAMEELSGACGNQPGRAELFTVNERKTTSPV